MDWIRYVHGLRAVCCVLRTWGEVCERWFGGGEKRTGTGRYEDGTGRELQGSRFDIPLQR